MPTAVAERKSPRTRKRVVKKWYIWPSTRSMDKSQSFDTYEEAEAEATLLAQKESGIFMILSGMTSDLSS